MISDLDRYCLLFLGRGRFCKFLDILVISFSAFVTCKAQGIDLYVVIFNPWYKVILGLHQVLLGFLYEFKLFGGSHFEVFVFWNSLFTTVFGAYNSKRTNTHLILVWGCNEWISTMQTTLWNLNCKLIFFLENLIRRKLFLIMTFRNKHKPRLTSLKVKFGN